MALALAATAWAGGGLDRTFSQDGMATTDFSAGEDAKADQAYSLAVDRRGRVVAAGYSGPFGPFENTHDVAVARYRRGGALDARFHLDGRRTIDVDGLDDIGLAVAVQPDNKIVVAGYANLADPASSPGLILRLLPNGRLDRTFSKDGIVTLDSAGSAFLYDVRVTRSGRILVAGTGFSPPPAGQDFLVARLRPGGALDKTFSGDGVRLIDFEESDQSARALTVDSRGRILLTGFSRTPENFADTDFLIARLRPGGGADTSFSKDGFTRAGIQKFDTPVGIGVRRSGRIVAGGTSTEGSDQMIGVVQLRSGGALDKSFSGDGRRLTDFGPNFSDAVYDMTLDRAGRLLFAGRSDGFVVVRLRPGGAPDATFGGDGKVAVPFGDAAEAWAVALQPDGKVVAAGAASGGKDSRDFAVARLRP